MKQAQLENKADDFNNLEEFSLKLNIILNAIVNRKIFIASITSFITILSMVYALNLKPTYIVTASFTMPNQSSFSALGELSLISETRKKIFTRFLTRLSSKVSQKIILSKNGYLPGQKFNNDLPEKSIGSISVKPPPDNLVKNEQLIELPYTISTEGSNSEFMIDYLDTIITETNNSIVNEVVSLNKILIQQRLNTIKMNRTALIKQAEGKRLSEIQRIRDNDKLALRQTKDSISRIRQKAKQARLDQISRLDEAYRLAKSLGIVENNFKILNNVIPKSESSNVEEKLALEVPVWYLYGEKALFKRIELLKNRTSDDPFIPTLVELNNQLSKIVNNNVLKNLLERSSDVHYLPVINELDYEKNKLENQAIYIKGLASAMQLSQSATSTTIHPKVNLIIILAFFLSLITSAFLALFIGLIRDQGNSTT